MTPDRAEPKSIGEFVRNFFTAIMTTKGLVQGSPEISGNEAIEISIRAVLARFSKEELACLFRLSSRWTETPEIGQTISDCLAQRNYGTKESLPELSAGISEMTEKIGKAPLLGIEVAQVIAVRSVISGLPDNVITNLISTSGELWAQQEMFIVLSQRRRGGSPVLN